MIEFSRVPGQISTAINRDLFGPNLEYRIIFNQRRASDFFRYFGVSDEAVRDIRVEFHRVYPERTEASGHYAEGVLKIFCDVIWRDDYDVNKTFLHEGRHCLDDYGTDDALRDVRYSNCYVARNTQKLARLLVIGGVITAGVLATAMAASGHKDLSLIAGGMGFLVPTLSGMGVRKLYGEFEAHHFAERMSLMSTWSGIARLVPVYAQREHQVIS